MENEVTAELLLPLVLTTKIFNQADQEAFARLSKDWNPMHMDPVQARRFISGSQVVHGINLLLTAVSAAESVTKGIHSIARVVCDFKVAVNIGEDVTFVLFENASDHAIVHVMLGQVICTNITLYFSAHSLGNVGSSAKRQSENNSVFLNSPVDLPEQSYLGFSSEISLDADADIEAGTIYPHLSSSFGTFFCLAFSRLSYIVGMVCPGLNSIFLSLDVTIPINWKSEQNLKFRVSKFEERIKLLELELESGFLTGKIKAFRRPSPIDQPDIADIEQYVEKGEFKQVRSLVLGGSRGLGELTCKILCAGGGKVVLGYALGKSDATRVQRDIENNRPGSCHIQNFDIKNDISAQLSSVGEFDSVYYFPTPHISKKINGVFSQGTLENFLEYYVFSFYRLCEQLEKRAKSEIKIYYPSSVFIESRPNGMTEYAMAKAASEIMIADINRTFRFVRIYCTRLPRLKSDQTNSIFQTKTSENLMYILPVIRQMHGL